eukprot:10036778-Heterocapsa_arctica.AAC.1
MGTAKPSLWQLSYAPAAQEDGTGASPCQRSGSRIGLVNSVDPGAVEVDVGPHHEYREGIVV